MKAIQPTDRYLHAASRVHGRQDVYKRQGLKEEGYWLDIRPGTMVLRAEKLQGLIWATVTAADLLENAGEGIPCGTIRDYPRYSVRGFHIDLSLIHI